MGGWSTLGLGQGHASNLFLIVVGFAFGVHLDPPRPQQSPDVPAVLRALLRHRRVTLANFVRYPLVRRRELPSPFAFLLSHVNARRQWTLMRKSLAQVVEVEAVVDKARYFFHRFGAV